MLLETDLRANERLHEFENFESAHRHPSIPGQHEKCEVSLSLCFINFNSQITKAEVIGIYQNRARHDLEFDQGGGILFRRYEGEIQFTEVSLKITIPSDDTSK